MTSSNTFVSMWRGILRIYRVMVSRFGFKRSIKVILIVSLRELGGVIIHPKKEINRLLTLRLRFLEDLEDGLSTSVSEKDKQLFKKLINIYSDDFKNQQRRFVDLSYIFDTHDWISDSLERDTKLAYQTIQKRINGVFEGTYNPLFVPLEIKQPNRLLITLLQSKDAAKALKELEGISPDEVMAALPNNTTALIHLVVGEEGTFAVISQPNYPPEIILCSNVTQARVKNVLNAWLWLYYWDSKNLYQKTLSHTYWGKPSRRDQFGYEEASWRIPHLLIFNNEHIIRGFQPTEVPIIGSKPLVSIPTWLLMEVILRELGTGYVTPGSGLWSVIDKKLAGRNVHRLIISPDKAFALFPHHAAILAIENDGRKEVLLDHYEISYLPQGKLSKVPTSTLVRPKRILATGTEGAHQFLSETAIRSLCSLAPENIISTHLPIGANDLEKTLKGYEGGGLTFVGHGVYDWEQPESSWLAPSETENTSSEDADKWNRIYLKVFLQAVASRFELITLAACEIGLPRISIRPSNYKGFAEDLLLEARIPNIIATLWPVYQVSTMLLMYYFHQRLVLENTTADADDPSIAFCLREAQIWLKGLTREQIIDQLQVFTELPNLGTPTRTYIQSVIEGLRNQITERPYSHPYFWAPFYIMGGIQ